MECVGRAEPPQRNEGLEETQMKTSDLQTHNLTILSSFPYFFLSLGHSSSILDVILYPTQTF